ncbi:hypothetical protein Peur_065531 [Populus x canadensis]
MERSALLLSMDVTARGLDFLKVRCINQYDSQNFYGEETSFGSCFQKLRAEAAAVVGWTIMPNSINEEEERREAKGTTK